jgi:hypothetical protein
MDGAELILILGGVALGILYLRQMTDNADFTGFMESAGASERDIASSIVPMNGTDPAQGATVSAVKSISDWANAIFHFEGGNPGNLNVRNNNPGNLKFAGQPNATPGANGFAVFPSIEDGFAALNRQLTKWLTESPSLTLEQFYAKYLGQADYLNPRVTKEGDPFAYAKNTADKLGVSPTQTIGSIFGGG